MWLTDNCLNRNKNSVHFKFGDLKTSLLLVSSKSVDKKNYQMNKNNISLKHKIQEDFSTLSSSLEVICAHNLTVFAITILYWKGLCPCSNYGRFGLPKLQNKID